MAFGFGAGGSGKHGLHIDSTNHIYSTGEFIFGGSSQFVSASNGNIEISSSNFHLDNQGNVDMTGTITATAGTIGGFNIANNAISSSATFKRGLILKPGDAIRGYGNEAHKTVTTAGKFSFGVASIAPPAGGTIQWSSDLSQAPGTDIPL